MSPLAAWSLIAISVVAEVLGTDALRHADGLSRPLPSAIAMACYGVAIWLMSLAMRQLEMGLTYAVWAASGTALTAAIGIVVYAESASTAKLFGLLLIIAGVSTLNLASKQ